MTCILYAGNFRLNPVDAAGKRVLELSLGMHLLGHEVYLLPMNSANGVPVLFEPGNLYEAAGDCRDRSYRDIVSTGIRATKSRSYSHVILYNPSSALALACLVRSKVSGFKAVLDCTEWYESSHLDSVHAKLEVIARMYVIYRMFRRAILVSPFLDSQLSIANSAVIPPLVRKDRILDGPRERDFATGDTVRFLYAGFPGAKDKVRLLADSLHEIAPRLPFACELHIAGPEHSELANLFPASTDKFTTVAHGRLKSEDLVTLYQQSDFSAVFRDDARYEKAGFPTKAVESWAQGVPVMVLDHSTFARNASAFDAVVTLNSTDISSALAQSLTSLYSSRSAYNKKSRGALQLAREQHVAESYLDDISKVLR
ncbi:Glycosyltransferase involved in cell wall bisynthesis [Parasphingorhabdus marina DSM 22363]|uniref:Glycosyltransferase involved in cell wall bisynthesis n=1 Tax=Parasphingorhabdus marina DSM 22363 TaxID=1123272 RepID=A0A1N6HQ90_9SPHN|nr:glycosyltransferase family 4 protein [Parasphingorhabdus marina]SIO21947.1 Glycosyltransferase involved in cell wall bisynthesis [Parasphingorhabdus marina DSM 22363]